MAYSLRKSFHYFKKLNIDLPYNLAILLLSIYSREMKTYPHKDLSTNVHSRKFYSSQKVKQSKCPSIDEWINKICRIHIMYFYWTIKKWTTDTFRNRDEPQLLYAKWKKPNGKQQYVLCKYFFSSLLLIV